MRLITTINIGNVWYSKYTIPSIRRYAHRIKADFLELTQFEKSKEYGVGDYNGHPWFLQIDFLKSFANQNIYDKLALIDLDVLIKEDCDNLFDIVGDNFGMSIDMGFPVIEKDGLLWNSYKQHLCNNDPNIGGNYYNSGVMVGTKNKICEVVSLINNMKTFESPQDTINIALKDYTIFEIDNRFNWLAPQFDSAKDKDIVHFVGHHKELIQDFEFRKVYHV